MPEHLTDTETAEILAMLEAEAQSEIMTTEQFEKYIENLGEYDPLWDEIFRLLGIEPEKKN